MEEKREIGEVEALIKEVVSQYRLPGLSVCIVEGDTTLVHAVESKYVKIRANLLLNESKDAEEYNEAGSRMELTSLLRVGSISKLFTSIAIMQLVEKGRSKRFCYECLQFLSRLG